MPTTPTDSQLALEQARDAFRLSGRAARAAEQCEKKASAAEAAASRAVSDVAALLARVSDLEAAGKKHAEELATLTLEKARREGSEEAEERAASRSLTGIVSKSPPYFIGAAVLVSVLTFGIYLVPGLAPLIAAYLGATHAPPP